MSDCLLIWWFDVNVWLLFFFLSSDVSTLQKNEYCRDHLMNELIGSKENMKIVYWLDVENWSRRTRKSTIDCRCSKLTDWLVFRTKKINFWLSFRRHEDALCKFFIQFTKIRFVTPWFSQRTWIESQMKYIHRFQRKNFTHWRFSFDSRISTSDLRFSDRRFFFDSRIFTSDLKFSDRRFSLITRVSLRAYLAILFNYSRISTSNLFQSRAFDRMSISFAEFKARDLLCKRQWIIVTAS